MEMNSKLANEEELGQWKSRAISKYEDYCCDLQAFITQAMKPGLTGHRLCNIATAFQARQEYSGLGAGNPNCVGITVLLISQCCHTQPSTVLLIILSVDTLW